MYYTYVLRSKIDNKLYVGYTKNLHKRVAEHNAGRVKSTTSRVPFSLVYYEACTDKDKAVAREKYFKTGYGRGFLNKRI